MKNKKTFAQISILLCILIVSCQSAPSQSVESQIGLNETAPIIGTATTTPLVIESQTINGVTVTIDWIQADAKRVSFDYTIDGLPYTPDAIDLFGTIQLVEKSGNGMLGWGGLSKINRVEDSPGTLVGSWSSVFAQPFTQPVGRFSLDFTLGDVMIVKVMI